MTLEERFDRQSPEDQVILGEIIDHFFQSDAGRLFKLMAQNLQRMEIQSSRNGGVNADRALGRIEAYDTVLTDLEMFVNRKRELQRPVEPNDEVLEGAEEITSPIRGGEI